jgi:G3E family GTPase
MAHSPIPLTLVTGFLGSGKTTLIKRLIQASAPVQFGLIENEFAELNIDAEILGEKTTGQDVWIEQTSGCLCCKLEGDLWPTIKKLLSQAPKPIEHLILETTGLADPGPLIEALLAPGPHKNQVVLDGVITLVDGQHFAKSYTELESTEHTSELVRQLIQASVVVLSKTDVADKNSLLKAKELIASLNPEAEILETQLDTRVPLELLHQEAFSFKNEGIKIAKAIQVHQRAFSLRAPALALKSTHTHLDVSSKVIEVEGELDARVFELFLNITLAKGGKTLLRAKGFLAFQGQPQRVLFQGVYSQFEFELGRAWKEGEARLNQMVVIGQEDMILMWERGIQNCKVKI